MSDSDRLIAAYLDGALTDADRKDLNTWLKADTANVRRLADAVMFEEQIRSATVAGAERLAADDFQPASSKRERSSRALRRFPFSAMAAGIVLGILCSSVTWVFAAPHVMATASRVFALVDGSFESRTGTLPSGFPERQGEWSGDESEIVSGDGFAPPRDGKRMLRFIRAEADAANPNSPADSCDVFQIVDLRALKDDVMEGNSQLELSAEFLDARTAPGTPIRFSCHLYLFAGTPEGMHRVWPLTLNESVGSGMGQFISTGGSSSKAWRKITAHCVLAPEADFAVIQIAAGRAAARNQPAPALGAQYCDDVRLTLKTMPVLPVRVMPK